MKQVLFMAALAAGILLAGCSKDSEDNGMEFTISENLVSLLAHDDYKITPSGAFTARSTNEDVATVSSDGTIHAVSAGNADIIFTSVESPTLTQTCKVNVDWRYKYFDEPILDFNATKEDIKEREQNVYVLEDDYTLQYEYRGKEVEMNAFYQFSRTDGRLRGVALYQTIRNRRELTDKVVLQLTERYGAPVDDKGDYIFPNEGFTIYCNSQGVGYVQK
jgi:hypothetical protein